VTFIPPRSRVGNKDVATLLLTTPGIQLNARNKMGWTCLVEAVRNGHIHIVQLLVTTAASCTRPTTLTEWGWRLRRWRARRLTMTLTSTTSTWTS
jgi:ankyrin repeat protein